MTPERWQRVKALFDRTVAHPAEEQSAFLREADEPTEVRDEVARLLEADRRQRATVDRTVGAVLAAVVSPAATTTPHRHLGPYRLGEEIGRGGMAIVYAAVRDDEQFRREVAIKLIRRGMDSASLISRFRQERQILANLDHPNIARLYDGGVTEDGVPYLVMERIDGEPIDRYCRSRQLPIEQRLGLMRSVCDAVQFAHQNLIVHRDLKPSNILVTADGVPKLLDFGIAKLLEPDQEDLAAVPTIDGVRPMTPGYASPEQVRGVAITTASDVYALGVLLYRLLTDQAPYEVDGVTPSEVQRLICEVDPPPPSQAIPRGDTGVPLARVLRGDLDTIVAKAMRKRPDDRYVSAAALSEDLNRHLSRVPIAARPATIGYRFGKFVRRHRLGVAAAAMVVLTLVGGIIATVWQAQIARTQRRAAVAEREVSSWSLGFLVDLFEVSHPDRALGNTYTVRAFLDAGAERVRRGAGPPDARATLLDAIGTAYLNLGLYDQAGPLLEAARDADAASPSDATKHGRILHNLGRYEALAGERMGRAAQLLSDAEAILRRVEAPAEQIAAVENDRLPVLLDQGHVAAVEPLMRAALASQEQALGSDHPEVARAANNLALLLRRLERWDEAETRYRQALAITRSSRGEGHLAVSIPLGNLGVVLREQGRIDEAIELFEQARAIELEFLPNAHPSPWLTQSNLALCYVAKRDWDQATALLDEALAQLRGALDEDRHEVAMVVTNLAGVHLRSRRYAEARSGYVDALERYLAAFGPDHIEVASVRNNLGVALIRLGRLAEAEAELEEALRINESLLGPRTAAVGRNLNNLSLLRVRQGDRAAAVALYRRALDARLAVRGEDHDEVAETRKNLAEQLLEIGEAGEAAALFEAAWRGYSASLGPEHAQAQIARVGLAKSLHRLGRPSDCEGHARAALEVWERHPRGAMGAGITSSVLGACLSAQGHGEEARARLVEGVERLAARLPEDHPEALAATRRLEEHRARVAGEASSSPQVP